MNKNPVSLNEIEPVISEGIKALIRLARKEDEKGTAETPKRALQMFKELLMIPAKPPRIKLFDSDGYDEMIISGGIEYYAFCEHHLLPFFGKVWIGYIPDSKSIAGLSKLARTVEYFSKGLNTQEYFTRDILDYLCNKIKPKGIIVLVEGRHLCQEMRGVKKKAIMRTSAVEGVFKESQKTREEFFNIINNQKE